MKENKGEVKLNIKAKRSMVTYLIIFVCAVCCGLSIFFASSNLQTAIAANNSDVQVLCAKEQINHICYSQTELQTVTSYDEVIDFNTGIKIYTLTNVGSNNSGDMIKMNSSSMYIDFTEAEALYISSQYIDYYDKSYKFEILRDSKIVWSAIYSSFSYDEISDANEGEQKTQTTYYKKVININGEEVVTQSEDKNFRQFNPHDFGRNLINLVDGNYKIQITRSYFWELNSEEVNTEVSYSANSTLMGALTVDTVNPVVVVKGFSSNVLIDDGAFINERVALTVEDSNPFRIYYKTPSMENYIYTNNIDCILGTENGLYFVYAVDFVGNRSESYSFYYDNKKPKGALYSDGISIYSGTYISKSFSYSATDSGSGIAALYIKTPIHDEYQTYVSDTVITPDSGDGWYYFYAVDNANNSSVVSSVYLETRPPLVEIYRNGQLSYSKEMAEAGSYDTDIYINLGDTLRISCDTSSGKATSNYELDTDIIIDNAYINHTYTITIISATGIQNNFTYHIVRNKPNFTIDDVTYDDGSVVYLKSDNEVMWSCDSCIFDPRETGVRIYSEGNRNINEFISYKNATSKQLTTDDGTETKYIITANDRADNQSQITVYIDKKAPMGIWETDGITLKNGGYTNKPLSFIFTESGVSATYSHNGGEFQVYTSGETLTADGTYVVILTDQAFNKSTYTAHIDTVAPTGQLYADYKPISSGTITNGEVYFTWDGGMTATVNGTPYTKNTMLSGDGDYYFVLTDFAGNSTEYIVTIDTVAPSYNVNKLNDSQQMISKWHLLHIEGKTYSFATYDELFEYACKKEYERFVTVYVLDNLENFNQHHLVAGDGKIHTGTYWLYKSKTNENTLLYYFDRNLLDEVIAFYAKSYFSEVKYFESDRNNEYGETANGMSDNIATIPDGTTSIVLNGFLFDKVDSTILYAELVGGNGQCVLIEYGKAFDEQVSVGGMYKFIELDEAQNVTVFYGFLDLMSPELHISATIFGNTESNELTINETNLSGIAAYYYESFNVKAISDADKWAILMIENNGKTTYYTYGDQLPFIAEKGEYLLSVYDRYGNGYTFTLYIVGNPAEIVFANNADKTAFHITITFEHKFDTLVALEIRRNGVTLSGITTDKLQYTFDRTGVYTVILRDNFGRVIEREYTFIKTLPSGVLEGVINGGKTKTDVTFHYNETEFFVIVMKDGKAVDTENSGQLVFTANAANSGKYDIRLIRITDEENFTDYTFVINTLAPDFDLSVEDGTTTNKNVIVSWTAEDIISVVYKLNGGEAVVIENGNALVTEGHYTVVAINDLGTQAVKTFVIDKTLDYAVFINGIEAIGGETTNGNVKVVNNEPLHVRVNRNGVPFEFVFGQVLSEEGAYIFRISDDYNNSTSFTMIIDKSVDVEANVGNGVISNEDVVISASEKVNLIATKDGFEYSYTIGTAITDEGFYKITIYDSLGNEKTLTFQIVKGTKTMLDYMLGDSVQIQSIDRDDEAVSADGNRLNFTVDGTYTVVCKSEGKEYTFTLSLDTTAPTIVLNGIENGGKGNVTVTITDLSEAGTVEVFKDGERIEYKLGDELKEYGNYEVRVSDDLGNERTYKFTLEYQMNGGAIALIVIGILAIAGVVVAIIFGKKAIYKKKGAQPSTKRKITKILPKGRTKNQARNNRE